MPTFKSVISKIQTLYKRVASSFGPPTYRLAFNENDAATFRNDVVVAKIEWSRIRRAVLWQADRITTESDNFALINEAGVGLTVSDVLLNFPEFIEEVDKHFPGFDKMASEYFGTAVGKWGAVEKLVLELKLGDAPKVIAGQLNNKQP